VPLLATRAATSYATGRERVVEALTMIERSGMSPADAALVLRAMARFVVGSSLAGAGAPPAADPPAAAGLREAGLPRLARLVEGMAGDPDDDALFALSLDALLDGLERRVAPHARGS
ncbi:MAG: TetR/AcrR family transcriptional regulator C-terminal domain-containing protein, partial [Miltoncostaeaceae bacterium]